MLGLTAVFVRWAGFLRRRRHHPHHFGYTACWCSTALGSVDASPAFRQIRTCEIPSHAMATLTLRLIIKSRRKLSLTRNSTSLRSTAKVAATYFDNEAFPDPTPEPGASNPEGPDFSHTQQLPGTDTPSRHGGFYSAAYRCLPPLKATPPPLSPASSRRTSVWAISDSGHQNYFVQGANLRFAGKDVFLKSHGFSTHYTAQKS
ncbi:hypothetical protein ACLK19_29455 [Escherichia coli]